ncbi:ATP-binding cassette domain-containing protein [Corynebacterium sanguinis]|uniref:AAA family ATPase n=1 Tax=Corynebacterium sanguinis TaxID=2594913 RepID=UPI0011AB2465|nr:AAA family ATPase [Corynebacterium sanguinis]TVS22985.1 ATP-binding cassette domain-containing protein [Corynebacterium sanguinis]
MTFSINWTVPTDGEYSGLEIPLRPGQVATLVGPNGAGKSALISWLNSQVTAAPVNRIVAHRRIWLASSGPEVTASRREQYSGILSRHDRDPESRTSGQYEEQRVSGVLYDLIARENGRNSRFVRRVESGEPTDDIEPSLLTTISDIMKAAGFDMRFEITDHMGLDVVHKSATYPISAMSDGEKAALLLAAEMLLAPVGSIQLLDEPERHFHRSVSPTLISGLIEARPDCGFVVSTHDLDLVERINIINNSVYFVKNVNWSPQGTPAWWEIQKLPAGKPINESARRAVFGGRQEILFVEGESGSLDLALLNILFPEYSVTPAGSSDNVQRAVSGLQSTEELHWVSAKGIIDGDARGSADKGKLREKQILVLPVNEIESLYYLPEVVKTQAKRQEGNLGEYWQNLFQEAQEKALESIRRPGVIENLAATNADKILRRSALASLPDKNALKDSNKEIALTLQSPYSEELRVLKTAVEQNHIATIVKEFSIRDSGLPTAVAKALRYGNKEDYQRAVTVTVQCDETIARALRELIEEKSSS